MESAKVLASAGQFKTQLLVVRSAKVPDGQLNTHIIVVLSAKKLGDEGQPITHLFVELSAYVAG